MAWKTFFRSSEGKMFALFSGGPYNVGGDGWVRWDCQTTNINPKNPEGFAFFRTREEARQSLRMYKNKNRGNRFLRKMVIRKIQTNNEMPEVKAYRGLQTRFCKDFQVVAGSRG
jgi:hypothetical protein